MQDDDIVPVFIPPLATWLAEAHKKKGQPLTETEVLRIRDKSPCIMMAKERADKMIETRGYRDVNPENCWVDWQRLRVQLTGDGYLPKIVVCVLGNEEFTARAVPVLEEEELECELRGHDDRMVDAFKASSARVDPTLTATDCANISAHNSVLYVLSDNFTAEDAPEVSSAILRVGSKLLQIGGVAMKIESSGITHSRKRWIELAEGCASATEVSDPVDLWDALFRAYVQYPIFSGTDYYTCGMHLLGKPDVVIADSVIERVSVEGRTKADKIVFLFYMFCMYLLSECEDGAFAPGHTFRPDASWPKLKLDWEECTNYDSDDYFCNPFGCWRFVVVI